MSGRDPLDIDAPNPWTTTAARVVYDNGLLRLREDAVIQPDGTAGRYTYVELPWPVVGIVPVGEDGQVHLVRQWRYAWDRNSWEIPAGHGEADETPLQSAQRELAEEVGLQAARWDSLGEGFSSASLTARYHLFLARELTSARDGHQRDGAEQDLITRAVPLVDAIAAAMDGRIEHSLSVIALLRTARRLGL